MNGTTGTHSPVEGTSGTPPIEPIFCSVPDTATALGLSRREVYRLLDRGEIKSIEQGRRRLVVIKSVREFAQRRIDAAEQAAA